MTPHRPIRRPPIRQRPIHQRPIALFVLPVLTSLAFTSCTAGPDYVSPFEASQQAKQDDGRWSDDWAGDSTGAEPAPESSVEASVEPQLDRWWQRFGDETLSSWVEQALAKNPSLGEATARVAEARALRDHVAGRELPRVAARGGVTELRQSENGSLPIDRIPGLDRDQTLFDIGFDASWEIDLAGRTRRSLEAADARLAGASSERYAAHLRIAAEVVRAYVALREGQRRLEALERQVASVGHIRDLVALRVEAGEDPRLDLARAEAELSLLQTRLPLLNGELRAAALALGVLSGSVPESGLALLDSPPGPIDLAPFPLGARADVLRRRPDVRAAERKLAAATADLGVATAELYPRLSIGARGGFQSMDVGELFESSSATWSLMPSITWRIFDGGRVRAEIHLAEARAEAAAYGFEASVLAALADAEQALARYRAGLDALHLTENAVNAARKVRDLEQLRHGAGETTLLPLLHAETRLDEALSAQAETRRATATELVALYKALGGGWDPSPTPMGLRHRCGERNQRESVEIRDSP